MIDALFVQFRKLKEESTEDFYSFFSSHYKWIFIEKKGQIDENGMHRYYAVLSDTKVPGKIVEELFENPPLEDSEYVFEHTSEEDNIWDEDIKIKYYKLY